MECTPEMESIEAWRAFLNRATEQEAYDAIEQSLHLARSFAKSAPTTSKRLRKFFDEGAAIYAERFGDEWLPF